MNREQLRIAIANCLYENLLKNGIRDVEVTATILLKELEALDVLKPKNENTESNGDPSLLRAEVPEDFAEAQRRFQQLGLSRGPALPEHD